MQTFTDIRDVPRGQSSVVSIGIFDGVHRGHVAVLKTLIERAHALGLPAVVVTFDPHPIQVHHPEANLQLIMPLPDRLDTLAAMGIDQCVVLDYTMEFAQLTAEDFVRQYFAEGLGAKEIVVGADVRLGKDNAGDLTLLRELGQQLGFGVVVVSDLQSPLGRRWSSTWVRKALEEGDVGEAAYVLGRPHRIRGTVQHGHQRGRLLGFPTANLDAADCGVVPADGVYAGWLVRHVPGTRAVANLPAAISVGSNPQFEGTSRTVEAHVLGRSDLDLYEEQVVIQFVERLRPMLTFESVDELLAQMDADLRDCARILGVPVAGRQFLDK